MTTVDKAHELFMSFDGRSPRQIYSDTCSDLGCRVNSALLAQLSDTVNDFYTCEVLDVEGNYFGGKGSFALLPLLQCHPRLTTVNFAGAGINDDVVLELVEILLDHGRIREVDLSNNPHISVFSGKPLSRLCRTNINLITFKVADTNIGNNVAAVLDRTCASNKRQMEDYFCDHYFRMKDMFIGLDVDGSGWVNINTFVSSVVFPWIQEKLKDRIAEVKPNKREDNCIDINTFMTLTYLTYKGKADIEKRVEEDANSDDDNLQWNWKRLLNALDENDVKCRELSFVRYTKSAISAEIATKAVQEAAMDSQDGVGVTGLALRNALKNNLPRKQSMKRMSSFFVGKLTAPWKLPSGVVKKVWDMFENRPLGLPASQILDTVLETDFHYYKLSFLTKLFNQYAIPIEDTMLTVQEVVNVMSEYCDVIRVDKALSVDAIREQVDWVKC